MSYYLPCTTISFYVPISGGATLGSVVLFIAWNFGEMSSIIISTLICGFAVSHQRSVPLALGSKVKVWFAEANFSYKRRDRKMEVI